MTTPSAEPVHWSSRAAVVLERACLEIGHRLVSVGFLVLVVAYGARAAGKESWLLFPIAFGCADVSLAAGLGAWLIAARRRTRKREATGVVLFSLLVLVPCAVMLVKIRNGMR